MNNPLKLNYEEMALGAAFGAALGFFVGPILAVIAALACAFLWAFGGSGAGRAWRFVGVPLVALAAIALARVPVELLHALASTGAALGVLTIGYGIPSTQPPDAGSFLGRFFYKLAGQNGLTANLLTRGTLALLLGLAYLPLAWVSAQAYLAMVGVIVALHLVAVYYIEGTFTL
ncbi:MAG: hypothetical protein MOGMAGMI_01979 [Candidatus Omnitrophica bacterium]|nr:hypothetical protein [Candidatus Omnitrophota bacterium]